MDRKELVDRIRNARVELEDVLARFDRRDLTEPSLSNGWSVKDILAHIGFWERRIATLYGILSKGELPQDTIGAGGLDELNARVFADNQLLPLGIVQLNEQEAYNDLLKIAETAPENDLFDSQRFDWTQGEPFYNWIVENTYAHYADHLPDLLEFANRPL